MFQSSADMTRELRPNVRGGQGSPEFCHLFSREQLGGRLDLLATVTLQPGESVGVHPHVGNGEVYCMLSGCATVTLSVPCRYIHSPASVCALSDVENQYNLVKAFLDEGGNY